MGAYGSDMDFYALKGAVEAILDDLRAETVQFAAPAVPNPSYHPGRCAEIFVGGCRIGVLGQIHPLVAQNYGVDAELYCAELDFSQLMAAQGADPEYVPLPKFPAVTRDLALVCNESVTVGALENCITANGGKLLRKVTFFDVYRGKGIDEGKKSVAFSLELRADDKTLSDEDIAPVLSKVLGALEEQLHAVLR